MVSDKQSTDPLSPAVIINSIVTKKMETDVKQFK